MSWKTTPLATIMWSVKTGGLCWQVQLYLKCTSFHQKCVAFQNRWSLMAVVFSRQVSLYITNWVKLPHIFDINQDIYLDPPPPPPIYLSSNHHNHLNTVKYLFTGNLLILYTWYKLRLSNPTIHPIITNLTYGTGSRHEPFLHTAISINQSTCAQGAWHCDCWPL